MYVDLCLQEAAEVIAVAAEEGRFDDLERFLAPCSSSAWIRFS